MYKLNSEIISKLAWFMKINIPSKKNYEFLWAELCLQGFLACLIIDLLVPYNLLCMIQLKKIHFSF